jgi:sialidase-1
VNVQIEQAMRNTLLVVGLLETSRSKRDKMNHHGTIFFWAVNFFLLHSFPAHAQHQIVCSGQAAGGYAAFPDICRLKNGDLFCVFYSGYGHVSTPNAAWLKGGQIMSVRSSDNGKTWNKPTVIMDTAYDDRDPSVACLRDGTLLLNWFTYRPDQAEKNQLQVLLSRSTDQGTTWSEPVSLKVDSPHSFACSAPARQLPDGSLILGLYTEDAKRKLAFGATVKSNDGGKTWKGLALIGEKDGVFLDAETDVIPLKDGKLLAALRSSQVEMHYSLSSDLGKTWGPIKSFGFKGHCPYFLRHSSGVILLAHRVPATSLHWSVDEGKTWHGPVQIDSVGGAYPSMIELPDGLVYCVYYEEGRGSSIRGVRLRVNKERVDVVSSSP